MSIKAETSFSLADQLFNASSVERLVERVAKVDKNFNSTVFTHAALARFPQLELKARIDWLVTCLGEHLPTDIVAATNVLRQALPEPLDPTRTDDDFGHFIWVVPGEYVARHGCTDAHLPGSLDFLREATKRFSSENAVRPFLQQFPVQTMRFLQGCIEDDNYHVRRWVSEGTRPFLPWAPRVDLPVADVVALLDRLHRDPTRYVTRSVANSLNDISKIDGTRVVTTLQRWQRASLQSSDELEWMTRHALRSLLKADDLAALALIGYSVKPKFSVAELNVSSQVQLGDALRYRCAVVSQAEQKLKVALRVYFLKANGSYSVKVFAVKDITANRGERIQIDKRVVFKPLTTRVLYPGEHFVELVVNGVKRGKRPFVLDG